MNNVRDFLERSLSKHVGKCKMSVLERDALFVAMQWRVKSLKHVNECVSKWRLRLVETMRFFLFLKLSLLGRFLSIRLNRTSWQQTERGNHVHGGGLSGVWMWKMKRKNEESWF